MRATSIRRRVAAGCAAALGIVAIALPQAAAGEITVVGAGMTIYVQYPSVKCKLAKNQQQGGKRFTATANGSGWKFEFDLNRFDGYHKYKILYNDNHVGVGLQTPGDVFYTNLQDPPNGVGKNAGYINFPKDKKGKPSKANVELSTVLYHRSGYSVGIYGQAKCVYKK